MSVLRSCSRPATLGKYLAQHQSFSNELLARGFDINELPEEDLDWILAETVLDIHEEYFSQIGLAQPRIQPSLQAALSS